MSNNIFVHSAAEVELNVKLSSGVKVWRFTHIREGAVIGENTSIGGGCFVGENVTIGKGCKIQNNVYIPAGVKIADDVFIGPGVTFTNIKYPRAKVNQKDNYITTLVSEESTIGAGAVILPGVHIGRCATVGAGAVVTHDVGWCETVVGNPARPLVKK